MTDPSSRRVDLDDSRVVNIERDPDFIKIALEQRRGSEVRNLLVTVVGPCREEVAHYVGEGITAPHPDPSLPLDFVELASAGPDHLELQGYLGRESWFTWRVDGSAVEIEGLASPGAPPNNSSKPMPLRGTA